MVLDSVQIQVFSLNEKTWWFNTILIWLGKISVFVGNKTCLIVTASNTQVTCQLSTSNAGLFNISLRLSNNGYSNSDKIFTYDLIITSLSQTQGSIGGGLNLTIKGQGFSFNSKVTICGNSCKLLQSEINSIACSVNSYRKTLLICW